ncbi:MAG: glucokinase, partial [Bdellovibrionales bacterium]|nr:glucokinase [Bdellovibrionales bacterium]
MRILAADIGGTSSRFAAFACSTDGRLTLEKSEWFRTTETSSFDGLLQKVGASGLPWTHEDADVVAIAAAGPVRAGIYCDPPHIEWDIDLSDARARFGIRRFTLMNDFVAQAYATQTDVGRNADVILPGELSNPDFARQTETTVGVIGAGTNLGKALLVRRHSRYIPVASEGGHGSFPLEFPEEAPFLEMVRSELGSVYVTNEQVVAGHGISYVHQFLTGERLAPEEVTGRCGADSETFRW